MTDWAILRTSGQATLPLTQALVDAGFEAWTPTVTESRRVRKTGKREDVPAALTPSFVFSRAGGLADLISLSRSPGLTYCAWDAEQQRMVTKGRPMFRVFRLDGIYPVIRDRELDALRTAEQRRNPRPKAKPLDAGTLVKLTEGGFAGLYGVVQETRGEYTTVVFPGWAIPVQFSTGLLVPVDTESGVHVLRSQSEQARSAKAA